MKKWMVIVLIVVCALIASLYIFIPATVIIQKSVVINTSPLAVSRLLIEKKNWHAGWLQNDSSGAGKDTGQAASFNGNVYSVADRKYSSLLLLISHDDDSIATSSLNIIALSKGSVQLNWEASVQTPANPFSRLKTYRQSKKIEDDLESMLNKMQSFYSQSTNVYGISIRQEPVVDSTLLSTYDSTRGYPTTEFIYSMVTKLKNYIASQDAKITGYPMLNVFTRDSIMYLTKVALPVDKKLAPSGKMAYRWMLPGGNILVTEVKGGSKAIGNAFQQMEYYLSDFGREAPAIPFFSLVTDRMQERDSTRWITRIYYPVMD